MEIDTSIIPILDLNSETKEYETLDLLNLLNSDKYSVIFSDDDDEIDILQYDTKDEAEKSILESLHDKEEWYFYAVVKNGKKLEIEIIDNPKIVWK